MEQNQNENHEIGWEDVIEKDSQFELLDPGDYSFKVESFERGRFDGSEKIPPCNMAIVHLNVFDDKGHSSSMTANLIMYSSMEWKLSEFFTSIGLKKKGEKLVMKWPQIVGCTGRCKIGQVNGKKNPDAKFNQIDKFYSMEDGKPAFKAGSF